MKILYILHQFFPLHHTGTERLTLDIAKQIQRMGNYVSVLTYEPSSIPKKLESNNSQNFNDDFVKLAKWK